MMRKTPFVILEFGPANPMVRGGLEEWLVHALKLKQGRITIDVADFLRKMNVKEQENDLLESIYDGYPEGSEEIDAFQVEGKFPIVHRVAATTLEEGQDWWSVENILDTSRDTMSGYDSVVNLSK